MDAVLAGLQLVVYIDDIIIPGLMVPHTLREEIMQELHAVALEGHHGVDKTVAKIKERFYWPGKHEDVNQWMSYCATRKSPPQRNCGLLQTIKAGYSLQVVAVDILGPFVDSKAGNS